MLYYETPVEGDFLDVRETLQAAGPERGTAPDRFVLEQFHHGLERGLIVGISDRSDRGDETFEHPCLGGLHRFMRRIYPVVAIHVTWVPAVCGDWER